LERFGSEKIHILLCESRCLHEAIAWYVQCAFRAFSNSLGLLYAYYTGISWPSLGHISLKAGFTNCRILLNDLKGFNFLCCFYFGFTLLMVNLTLVTYYCVFPSSCNFRYNSDNFVSQSNCRIQILLLFDWLAWFSILQLDVAAT